MDERMFQRLFSFLQALPGGPDAPRVAADDPRIAAAALLFHVMAADGVQSENEQAVLRQALQTSYGLAGSELEAIMKAGEEAEREAVDLYAFTSVLQRELNEQQRVEFIALMWQIVFADGESHELEDNTVWRVAELMGVDRRARMELRSRASGRTPSLEAINPAGAD
jgi:uncharacterized tellurite resistance protein B-like protein